jgi:endonuclease/exonuclease/phosphatase family metal-dependent hydrolase
MIRRARYCSRGATIAATGEALLTSATTRNRLGEIQWGCRMGRPVAFVALASVLLGLTGSYRASAAPAPAVTVVTQNVYIGGDLSPILGAPDLEAALAAAGQVFAAVQASHPAARMVAVADEIANRPADLIGLQEAMLWRSGEFGSVATTVEFDFVQLLVDALAARGLSYAVVAITTNVDAQFPVSTAVGLREIRVADRDVILVRVDSGLELSNVQTANFQVNVVFPTLLGPFTSLRGWASVDVTAGDTTVRFVTTHLEGLDPGVRLAQASEVLAGPANTPLPVVLVCDCNSSATTADPDATYVLLRDAGFSDAWATKHPGADGVTCCQDADVRNVPSALFERIDYVFFRGDFDVRHASLLGASPGDRTAKPDRVWPSDHAGVSATLELP